MVRCLRCGNVLTEGQDVFRIDCGELYCTPCADECFSHAETALVCGGMGYIDTKLHKAVIDLNGAREYLEADSEATIEELAEMVDDDELSDTTFFTEYQSECDDPECFDIV